MMEKTLSVPKDCQQIADDLAVLEYCREVSKLISHLPKGGRRDKLVELLDLTVNVDKHSIVSLQPFLKNLEHSLKSTLALLEQMNSQRRLPTNLQESLKDLRERILENLEECKLHHSRLFGWTPNH